MDSRKIEDSLKVIEAELQKIRDEIGPTEPRKTAYGPEYGAWWENT
ncbi:hypothetical protein [Kocuria palustris]